MGGRRSWTWPAWMLGAMFAAGCVSAPAVRPDPQQAQDFAHIVEHLASPQMAGRGAGEPGLDRARDDLTRRFVDAGLAPAFADGSFTQPIDISLGVTVEAQSLSMVLPGAVSVPFTPGMHEQFNALGLSGDGAFDGELVFVGYGIVAPQHEYDSYAGLDADALHGKVAVAFRFEPMDEYEDSASRWADASRGIRWSDYAALADKARWAADHGASALLVVNPPAQDRVTLRSTARTSLDTPAPIPVIHVSSKTFDRMLEAAGRAGHPTRLAYQDRADRGVGRPDPIGITVRGRVKLRRPRAVIHNVAGVVPGSGGLAGQIVVVGAHYDHLGRTASDNNGGEPVIHPGADDNASGTAVVVLLADRLADYARDHPDTPRRAVLLVCFSGEERGLLGSAYLVEHPDELAVDLGRTVVMVNFDMVGRLRRRVLYVFGAGSGTGLREAVEQFSEPFAFALVMGAGPQLASDNASFLRMRIPAVHVYTGLHEDYHQPTDTADKINADGGALIVQWAQRLVLWLATEPTPPTFVDDPPSGLIHEW